MAALKVSGTVRVPGDKSISHRALMLSALSASASSIRGILRSADVESTARVLRSLGVAIPPLSDAMTINGVGLRGMSEPKSDLNCGNSGTTARLVAGIVAAQQMKTRFTGDASLSKRPMRRIAQPLEQMGARITFENVDGLPMRISGTRLAPIDWDTRAASAQAKSAVLLGALVSGVEATVREAMRSRDHTERMLSALGAGIRVTDTSVHLTPVSGLRGLDITVPGDPSSAAFFIALATLAEDGELLLPGVCVNATRGGFISAVARMGGSIEIEDLANEGGEDTATLRVRPATLHPIQIIAEDVPAMIDELPMLACLAAGAGVGLEISGAAELRVKESDRIRAIVGNLKRVGVFAEERPDGLLVPEGKRKLSGVVITHGDHRIAMAFGVLARLPGNEIIIDDRNCADISYPAFWSDLDRATA